MRFSTLVSAATLVTASLAADAPVTNNVPGTWAIANMPGGGDKTIVAQFAVSAAKDGGVNFVLNINGPNPLTGSGFMYHIHEKAVPSNGNCTATGAHLDPFARGEDPPCDNTNPASCQVGDLSGKHGTCASIPGCSKNFTDKYLSLTPGDKSYIGDKSIVIHYPNKTRIACANFALGNVSASSNSSSSSGSSTSSASGTANTGSPLGGGIAGGSSTNSGASATATSSGADALKWTSSGALVMAAVGLLGML